MEHIEQSPTNDNLALSTKGPSRFRVNPSEELVYAKKYSRSEHGVGCSTSVNWDGSNLVFNVRNRIGAVTEILRESLDLPPGIKLEIVDNHIVQIEDYTGGVFYENRISGIPSSCLDILLKPSEARTYTYIYITAENPLQHEGKWQPNLGLKYFPYMPEDGSTVSNFSGIGGEVQTFLDSKLRYMLEQKDLASQQSKIDVMDGKVRVLGPTRYDEVLLTYDVMKDARYSLLEFLYEPQIFYNPKTQELRITGWGVKNQKILSGSVKSGKLQFEVLFETTHAGATATYELTPKVDNTVALNAADLKILDVRDKWSSWETKSTLNT